MCRLRKALYGLKQSPRAWFARFTKAMLGMGVMIHVARRGDIVIKCNRKGRIAISRICYKGCTSLLLLRQVVHSFDVSGRHMG